MKIKTHSLLLYSIVLWFCPRRAHGSEMKLELLQVLFRHGHRTPDIKEYPYIYHDPELPTEPYPPYGFGQLTNKGKVQSYKLGTLLRKKYDKFLGNYKPNEVHGITTNFPRTKMTLQLVLAGLYNPVAEETWHPEIKWQPIPYYFSEHLTHDINVALIPFQMPKYKAMYTKEISESEEFQNKISKYSDFLKDYQKLINVSEILNSEMIFHIGRPCYLMKYHKRENLSLPNWCTDELISTLTELVHVSLESMSLTTKLKRFNGGVLIRRMIQNINENRNAVQPKKLYLYSAHDITVSGFIRAQNASYFSIPPPACTVVLEKYSDDEGKEYVRMLGWDGESDDFMTLKFGDHDEYCPYEEYLKIFQDVIPTDDEIAFLSNDDSSMNFWDF